MAFLRIVSLCRFLLLLSLLLLAFATTSIAASTEFPAPPQTDQPVYEPENQNVVHLPTQAYSSYPLTKLSQTTSNETPTSTPKYSLAEANTLHDLHFALCTMQDHYFAVWLGKYTTAIDWTAAIMSTYVSATLSSLSHSLSYTMPGTFDKARKLDVEAQMVENEINKYFAQTTSYYFGEDHFAIRMQAFDDMLWVVLGWLEATRFIEGHSQSHYAPDELGGKEWHASQFVPAFAHRARVFYELAEKGWDWRLCGGGMTWNPRLLPYKNAITNQLFISASISMYLHFPGDENCSPFLSQYDKSKPRADGLYDECDGPSRGRYDPIYLANAINAYEWLKNIGMTNEQGLYVDGFHIGGYRTNHSKITCDERNEMVYTYNQGVILSGLRGLWEATGKTPFLEEGHELIRNVIRATGWKDPDLHLTPSFKIHEKRKKDIKKEKEALPLEWAGLGSGGVLQELCDPSGHCSQDGQTFKGIFFHHLTAFCESLPARPVRPGRTHAATRETAMLHERSCREYTGWVVHNAQAALRTRDADGVFGGWWGAPDAESESTTVFGKRKTQWDPPVGLPDSVIPDGAVDHRNTHTDLDPDMYFADERKEYSNRQFSDHDFDLTYEKNNMNVKRGEGDLNDRGRGRTVETQGSGLAVVRAMWEFLRRAEGEVDFGVYANASTFASAAQPSCPTNIITKAIRGIANWSIVL